MTRRAEIRVGMGIGALQRACLSGPIQMTTHAGPRIGASEVVAERRRKQLGVCCAAGSFGNVRREEVTLHQCASQRFS